MEPIRTQEAGRWQPRDAGRPLLAWSAQQGEALGAALGRALAEWREAWGIAVDASPVRCEPATSATVLREGWRALGEGAWLHAPADSPARLEQVLFDATGAAGSIAGEVSEACARDALHRLAAALRLGDADAAGAAPTPGLGQPWSGALQATLPGTTGWSLLLGAWAMQAWCRDAGVPAQDPRPRTPREPLCTAAEALGARLLALNVELSGCELDLGTLQGLQIGDVVRLRQQLQAPARLTDGEGHAVFDGFLVAQQGRKAIELVKAQAH